MRKMNIHSLKFRMVAFGVTLAAIGILVRQFVALPLIEDFAEELAARHQRAMALYIAHDVDESMATRLALIERLVTELPAGVATQPEALAAWIRGHQRVTPLFGGGLIATRSDGTVLAAYPAAAAKVVRNPAAADWFLAAHRASGAVVGRTTRDAATGEPVLVFASAARDAQGQVTAVIAGVAILDAPTFLQRLHTMKSDGAGVRVVSPRDRVIVMSSDPDEVLQPTPPPAVDTLHDKAMSGYRGAGMTVNAKGVEEIVGVASVGSTGWFVAAHVARDVAMRGMSELRNFVYKTTMILFFFVLTVMLLVMPWFFNPLTRAAQAIRDMAEGRRKIEQLPMTRADEVGQLVSGFNVLVERLHAEEAARAASEERLKYLAHHDALTGLCNRTMLEERLEFALGCAERDGTEIALLFCDLDDFKAINDRYGHDGGDVVLREVATRLTDGRRRADTVARLGGDEFVILLTALQNGHEAATIVARQVLASVTQPYIVDGESATVGMSIGIAVHAGPAVAPSYLIAQADVAMYEVKRKGKQDFFFMDDVFDANARRAEDKRSA